jgi:hypothetical protein
MHVSIFWTAKYEKEIMLEFNGKPSSVNTFSTAFSFQNLAFWILFQFSLKI